MAIYTTPNPPATPVAGDIWINPQGIAVMWNGATWNQTSNPLTAYPQNAPRGYINASYPRRDGNRYG
jgi:hypothetical protein